MRVGTALLIGFPGALALALLGPAHAQGANQGAKRQVGAHVHGASKLRVSVEDQVISMELDAPAQDIVGFEARPRTDKQRAAVEQAAAALRDPLKLFAPTPAAGCAVESAAAELVFEEARAERGPAAGGSAPHGAADSSHAEFQGRYRLVCASVDALRGIDFPYFKLFPRVEEVEAQVITADGPRSFEVKRNRPRLNLRAAP